MARTRNEALHKRRKSEIISAAAHCFAAKGIHQTSMQEICNTARISAGALYRYFDSKEAIIVALAESEKAANGGLIDYLVDSRDIVEGLCQALPTVLKILCNEQYGRLAIEIRAEASRSKTIAKVYGKNEIELQEALSKAFKEGQKLSTVDTELNARGTAFMILAMFDGISGRYMIKNSPGKKKIIESMQQFLRRTLRTQ